MPGCTCADGSFAEVDADDQRYINSTGLLGMR